MTARRLHRVLAGLLGVFLMLHLGNHLAGLWGQDTHRAVQEALRRLYRNPLTEPLLLAAVVTQIGLGLQLLWHRRKVSWQTASGLYLAVFLAIHVGAVLTARMQGVDTDLAFAAAGLHAPAPWPLVFSLYYGAAVAGLGLHLWFALRRTRPIAAALIAVGCATTAMLILALLSGRVTPLTIPPSLISQFPAP